jgi:Uma2 family endonuclease
MTSKKPNSSSGPFRADQLRDGDRYELADGHPIYCAPSGPDHANRNLSGGAVIESDPGVEWAGTDAGFTPAAGTLWAPDIAVAPAATAEGAAGWMPGVPPLAIEYAGKGQDEDSLREKVADLLAHGTRLVWVVRLLGPRRVEVHAPGASVRTLGPGDQLEAPGILRNPVPVEALYDRDAGHRATLRNLLQRQGYADLDAVLERGREEGEVKGKAEGKAEGKLEGKVEGVASAVVSLLRGRGLIVPEELEARIMACRDRAQLERWLLAAATVDRAEAVLSSRDSDT